MSLSLSLLPRTALSDLAGAMREKPLANLESARTAWQCEMERALTQAGFHHPMFQHQYQHEQDDPDAGTCRFLKRPDEPDFAAAPACAFRPSAPPRFPALQDLTMPAAVHQKPASALPAPPIRLHAEWAAQGVMVWLGADAEATPSTPQLTQQIKLWLGEHGVQLLSLVCNGKSLYAAPYIIGERKAAPGAARPALHDFPSQLNSQET